MKEMLEALRAAGLNPVVIDENTDFSKLLPLNTTHIVVDEQYKFDYPTVFVTLPEYTEHAGQIVTVLRQLTESEADGPKQECEQMYLIRADDGWEGHAFECELKPL